MGGGNGGAGPRGGGGKGAERSDDDDQRANHLMATLPALFPNRVTASGFPP